MREEERSESLKTDHLSDDVTPPPLFSFMALVIVALSIAASLVLGML